MATARPIYFKPRTPTGLWATMALMVAFVPPFFAIVLSLLFFVIAPMLGMGGAVLAALAIYPIAALFLLIQLTASITALIILFRRFRGNRGAPGTKRAIAALLISLLVFAFTAFTIFSARSSAADQQHEVDRIVLKNYHESLAAIAVRQPDFPTQLPADAAERFHYLGAGLRFGLDLNIEGDYILVAYSKKPYHGELLFLYASGRITSIYEERLPQLLESSNAARKRINLPPATAPAP